MDRNREQVNWGAGSGHAKELEMNKMNFFEFFS